MRVLVGVPGFPKRFSKPSEVQFWPQGFFGGYRELLPPREARFFLVDTASYIPLAKQGEPDLILPGASTLACPL